MKNRLSSLVNAVYRQETRVLVEKSGIPVAAPVSTEDLKRLAQLDERLAERRRVVEAMRAPFRGVPAEEIERETDRIVSDILAENRSMRAETVTRG